MVVGRAATVWVIASLVLAWHFDVAGNVAVIACGPRARDLMLNAALPLLADFDPILVGPS